MTTARQIWEYALTELSKVNAPSLLLHEFNYYINKAISQYINKRYNIYDINQQTTDDLRVLKATAVIKANKLESEINKVLIDPETGLNLDDLKKLDTATYEVILPDDYLHILNCICVYKLAQAAENCYDKGDIIQVKATRLTADAWSNVINDYYNRPMPWNPYYYIHNVNKQNELPTNPVNQTINGKQEFVGTDQTSQNPFPELILKKNGNIDELDSNYQNSDDNLRKSPAYTRHANSSKVKCQIRYGQDDTIYKLAGVKIDYLKAPQHIRLTKQQVDLTTDTSQIMEYPDYVCQEIINELVMLLMARTSDPRLQTQMAVSQSIAQPQQAQATPQQTQQ